MLAYHHPGLIVNIFSMSDSSEQRGICVDEHKENAVRANDSKRERKRMVFQLLDLEPGVAPVLLENIFLLAVQALHANGELLKFFGEFLGVNNLHSRVWT